MSERVSDTALGPGPGGHPGSAVPPSRRDLHKRSPGAAVAAGGHSFVATCGQILVAADSSPAVRRSVAVTSASLTLHDTAQFLRMFFSIGS